MNNGWKLFLEGVIVGLLIAAFVIITVPLAFGGDREVKYHYDSNYNYKGQTIRKGWFETHYDDRYNEIGYTLIDKDDGKVTHFNDKWKIVGESMQWDENKED